MKSILVVFASLALSHLAFASDGVIAPSSVPMPPPRTSTGEEVKTLVIRYEPGSSTKLEQLIGDEDKELHKPTRSQTVMRYQLQGTDLGYSFEHEGRVYFLFGDTLGSLDRALDTIATTDTRDPEAGVRLDFLTINEDQYQPVRPHKREETHRPHRHFNKVRYLTIQPPGISMGAFEVPVSSISLEGQMYVVVSTNHSTDRTTDRSVLTKYIPPGRFEPLRTISQLPAGRLGPRAPRPEGRSGCHVSDIAISDRAAVRSLRSTCVSSG